MKKLKIAHIQLLSILSGVQNVSVQELKNLSDDEFDKYIVCKEPGPLSVLADSMGIKVFFCNSLCREINPFNDLFSFIFLYKLFRSEKFDIVHTHSAKTGFLARIAAKLSGVNLVVHTVHGFAFDSASSTYVKNFYMMLEKIAARFTDCLICLHNMDKDICIKQLNVPENIINVIPNGVDVELYKPSSPAEKQAIREKFGIQSKTLVFVMVGRLWTQKNPSMFVKSAIQFIDERPDIDAKFLIVGDGELKRDLQELIIGYENKITLLGWQNNVSQILKMSDVFVLPSLWEGMPLASLEALSVGLPCLVSNIPGNISTVIHDVDGYIFPLDGIDELKNLMFKLMDNTLRRKLSCNARYKIEKFHNISDCISKIRTLYAELN